MLHSQRCSLAMKAVAPAGPRRSQALARLLFALQSCLTTRGTEICPFPRQPPALARATQRCSA